MDWTPDYETELRRGDDHLTEEQITQALEQIKHLAE